TTASHAIAPASSPACHCTPVTRRPDVDTPVTLTPSTMVAPLMRAPLASEIVRSVGLVFPSPGIHTAPARSSVRRIGAIRAASAGGQRAKSDREVLHPVE